MLQEIETNVAHGNSFAFETTLAGVTYACMIPQWQAAGYQVKLILLSLWDADEAMARVAQRVQQGGHSIPPDVIGRRFASGMKNFQLTYRTLVNAWQWYDNSGRAPQLVDEGETT